MTYSSKELAAKGVSAAAIGFRRWRRERGLSVAAMAHMLELSTSTLRGYEGGWLPASDRTKDKIAAFRARWERVPEVREALEAEVRRSKLRYRAAALGRCKARGFKVPDECANDDGSRAAVVGSRTG